NKEYCTSHNQDSLPQLDKEMLSIICFFFSSRRRHTRSKRDWSSDVCSSDLSERRCDRFDPGHGHTSFRTSASEPMAGEPKAQVRSEERRVGEEWGTGGAAAE